MSAVYVAIAVGWGGPTAQRLFNWASLANIFAAALGAAAAGVFVLLQLTMTHLGYGYAFACAIAGAACAGFAFFFSLFVETTSVSRWALDDLRAGVDWGAVTKTVCEDDAVAALLALETTDVALDRIAAVGINHKPDHRRAVKIQAALPDAATINRLADGVLQWILDMTTSPSETPYMAEHSGDVSPLEAGDALRLNQSVTMMASVVPAAQPATPAASSVIAQPGSAPAPGRAPTSASSSSQPSVSGSADIPTPRTRQRHGSIAAAIRRGTVRVAHRMSQAVAPDPSALASRKKERAADRRFARVLFLVLSWILEIRIAATYLTAATLLRLFALMGNLASPPPGRLQRVLDSRKPGETTRLAQTVLLKALQRCQLHRLIDVILHLYGHLPQQLWCTHAQFRQNLLRFLDRLTVRYAEAYARDELQVDRILRSVSVYCDKAKVRRTERVPVEARAILDPLCATLGPDILGHLKALPGPGMATAMGRYVARGVRGRFTMELPAEQPLPPHLQGVAEDEAAEAVVVPTAALPVHADADAIHDAAAGADITTLAPKPSRRNRRPTHRPAPTALPAAIAEEPEQTPASENRLPVSDSAPLPQMATPSAPVPLRHAVSTVSMV